MTGDATDLAIFWLVVGARFLIPLAIPRFPLPAVVGALVLDGVDQSIFQTFTQLDLTNYQSYDKALDVYYLSIAYLSTMRNWRSSVAFSVARFLLYYRLVGVMLFELVGARWLLLLFPNTFEYFFIAVELIRLRKDPVRLSRRFLIGLAAAIWIFVKLPQEWWIHVAQLDVTDTLKEYVFGVPTDASWATAVTNRPWVTIGIVVLLIGLVLLAVRLLRPRIAAADPADRRGVAADPLPADVADTAARAAWRAATGRLVSSEVVEQVALVTLVCGIFAEMLPGEGVGALPAAIAVVVLVLIDTGVGLWIARRGRSAGSVAAAFAALLALNVSVVLLGAALFDISLDRGATTVFLVLLVLLVALYSAYRPVLTYRRAHGLMDVPVGSTVEPRIAPPRGTAPAPGS